jgi:hypothetical protein
MGGTLLVVIHGYARLFVVMHGVVIVGCEEVVAVRARCTDSDA